MKRVEKNWDRPADKVRKKQRHRTGQKTESAGRTQKKELQIRDEKKNRGCTGIVKDI